MIGCWYILQAFFGTLIVIAMMAAAAHPVEASIWLAVFACAPVAVTWYLDDEA